MCEKKTRIVEKDMSNWVRNLFITWYMTDTAVISLDFYRKYAVRRYNRDSREEKLYEN